MMKNKFWNHIENRLLMRDGPIYFVGGTLCVDFVNYGVAMNLDGKGFIYGGFDRFRQNSEVYLPGYITEIVRDIFLNEKNYSWNNWKQTHSSCRIT